LARRAASTWVSRAWSSRGHGQAYQWRLWRGDVARSGQNPLLPARAIAAQLRAARALASLDQRALAEVARLSVPTIQRMEASEGVIRGNVDSLTKLVSALENAGVELIGEGAASPGGGRGARYEMRPLLRPLSSRPAAPAAKAPPDARRSFFAVRCGSACSFCSCGSVAPPLGRDGDCLLRRARPFARVAGRRARPSGRPSFSGGHCPADRPALGRRQFSA
jgi:transcriptional regulator with XRE-family HTH domain